MIDWNIQSRSHACQACEQPFVDKQSYHTLLFDDKHAYQRIDVCDQCWTSQYSQGANDRKGFISHWHGVYNSPPAAAPEAIQKENAETLLRKLIELNNPKYGAACFILAVMLERKRLLKIQSQFKQEGRRVFVYEQPKTGDVFTITDPDLHLDQLQSIQHEVSDLLEHGVPSAAPEPATPLAAVEPAPEATPATADAAVRSESPVSTTEAITPNPEPGKTTAVN